MKVRLRNGAVYEVAEETPHRFILKRAQLGLTMDFAVLKVDCELLPEEPIWRDVTSECEVDSSMVQLTHKPDGSCIISHLYTARYRLRKVKLFTGPEEVRTWAFIVEKREP